MPLFKSIFIWHTLCLIITRAHKSNGFTHDLRMEDIMKRLYRNCGRILAMVYLLTAFAGTSYSQSQLFVSKSPDYSTADRDFSRGDTLYMKVVSPDLDYTNLDEMEYKLRSRPDGEDVEGHLTNHFDGTYTASLALSGLPSSAASWELRVEIEDKVGRKFKGRVMLNIPPDGSPPPPAASRLEIKGIISDIEESRILVRGLWILVTDSTEIRQEDSRVGPNNLMAGMYVEIKALSYADGSIVATRIKIKNKGGNQGEVELKGIITAIGPDSIVVEGTTFFVDGSTRIYDREERPIQLGDLSTGLFVEVKGRVRGDGRLWAEKIELEDGDDWENEQEITGAIESITDSSLTVAGITFRVDAQTRVYSDDDRPVSYSALAVGTLVEVKGVYRGDGNLWAVKIKIEDSGRGELEVKGTIEAIEADAIVVNGLRFLVDSATVIYFSSDRPADFSTLQVGMLVEIKAFRQNDGSLLAIRIEIEDADDAKVEIKGAIQNLTANTITVFNMTFLVDSTTQILDDKKNPLSFADLQVGMIVEIKGRLDAGGALVALRIKVEDREADEIEVKAIIDSLDAQTVYAAGLAFRVDQNTIILNAQKQPIDFSALQAGLQVEIKARRLPDGTILALRIKIEDQNGARVELKGTITRIAGDTVVVEQTLFLTDSNTRFLDRNNQPISLNDFAPGEYVEAEAQVQKNGIWVLKKLKKEDPVSMQGQVQAAENGQIVVLNTTVLVTDNTLIVGPFNTPLDASALQTGSDVLVQGTNNSDNTVEASTIVVATDAVTSVSRPDELALPFDFELLQNYPNPFNPATTLQYRISARAPQRVTLKIYNLLGQEVATLVDGVVPPGSHSVVWNATDANGKLLPTGIYFARIKVGQALQVRRMVLSK